MYSKYKVDYKNINSKLLRDEIINAIDGNFKTRLIVGWERKEFRDGFVEIIANILVKFQDDGRLDYFKVVCDTRNNTYDKMEAGQYKLDVYYKQSNCLNVSELNYDIVQFIDPTWFSVYGINFSL